MITNEQIAHDLALMYVSNRHGSEVVGDFSVATDSSDQVYGTGTVETRRLPDADEVRMRKVGTGGKRVLGLLEKKVAVPDGFKVDATFRAMLDDYFKARARFAEMLSEQ